MSLRSERDFLTTVVPIGARCRDGRWDSLLLQQLTTFCTVVDENGFTRAAEVLSISQPAVSKQVQSLEQHLRTTLLVRTGRQLSLTPSGEIVYSYARRVMHTIEELRGALENLAVPGYGRLSIGSVSTVALFTLPQLLGSYAKQHPLVTVHVRTGSVNSVLRMVLRNEIDVGLVTVPLNHELIRTVPLFRDRIMLVAGPDTVWARDKVVSAERLSRMPMIAYERNSKFRGYVDASFEAAGVTPDVIMEFDSHEAVKAMVKAGFGVAMEPWSAIADELHAGRLVELTVDGLGELGRMTSLIVRRDRHYSPPVRAFVDLVRSMFSNLADPFSTGS